VVELTALVVERSGRIIGFLFRDFEIAQSVHG